MKLVSANVDNMQVFLIIINVGLKISVGVNVKNWLKRICDKGFIWNPVNCQCECDTPCDAGEHWDYESFKCKKKLVDKLVEKCSENIDEKE